MMKAFGQQNRMQKRSFKKRERGTPPTPTTAPSGAKPSCQPLSIFRPSQREGDDKRSATLHLKTAPPRRGARTVTFESELPSESVFDLRFLLQLVQLLRAAFVDFEDELGEVQELLSILQHVDESRRHGRAL